MLEDHRYFSRTLKRITIAVLAVSLLGGCSMTANEGSEGFRKAKPNFLERLLKKPAKKREGMTISDLIRDAEKTPANATDPVVTGNVDSDRPALSVQSFKPVEDERRNFSSEVTFEDSATCRYIRRSADSEAVIIGSPTVSASSDEDGSGSVSIGMNLFDFKKSDLVRASGDARCRLHEASRKIQATLGLGVEATRFASAWAKQDYIRNNTGYLNSLNARAQTLMQQGSITKQDANQIARQVNGLKAEMEKSRAVADQRRELPAISTNDVRSRHGALVEATNDLQNIERDIRTTDALELSVSAGYRYNEEFNNTLQRTNNDGAFARVSLGVRLGALSARRQRLEDEAADARLDALFEQESGTIWKSDYSKRAATRMIADLGNSERELTRALAHNENTIAQLSDQDRPEVIRTMLMTKIDKVRIGAERAAVRAAIQQIRSNRKNIEALSE